MTDPETVADVLAELRLQSAIYNTELWADRIERAMAASAVPDILTDIFTDKDRAKIQEWEGYGTECFADTEWVSAVAREDCYRKIMKAISSTICIVCDWKGDTARFIEAEIDGASVSLPWHDRPDGLKELRIERIAHAPPAVPVESLGRDAAFASDLDAALRARGLPMVANALGYSRNFAAANPHLTQTAKDHINGLCDMLEIAAGQPAPPPASVPDGWPIADQEERELGWNWNYKWLEELHDDAVKAGWYSSMEAIDHVLTKLATTPEESP